MGSYRGGLTRRPNWGKHAGGRLGAELFRAPKPEGEEKSAMRTIVVTCLCCLGLAAGAACGSSQPAVEEPAAPGVTATPAPQVSEGEGMHAVEPPAPPEEAPPEEPPVE